MYKHLKEKWDGSGREAASHGRRGLVLYGELRLKASDARSWKIYPKHHLLLHCLEEQVQTAGNPMWCWCYCDESEIGAAKALAKSLHPTTLQTAIMEKYRLNVVE